MYYARMGQGDGEGEAHDDGTACEPVAKVNISAVVVCAKVILACTSSAESVGQRSKDEGESDKERKPIGEEGAREDDEEEPEGKDERKKNDS